MNKKLWFSLILCFFLLDIGTKDFVAKNFRMSEEVMVIPHFFSLTYTTNRGIAFSLFADVESQWKMVLLTVIAIAALAYIFWIFLKESHHSKSTYFALALIAGGILGNSINRLATGAVVDFLDFHIGAFTWPTFNLADTFICVGAGLVLLSVIRGEKD